MQANKQLIAHQLDNEIHDRKLMLTLFTNLNESNILQVYFAKMARIVFGILLFNFSFELRKCLFLLSQQAVIPKFLDLSNLNYQGLCELISLLVQQNLGCFLIHVFIAYLTE